MHNTVDYYPVIIMLTLLKEVRTLNSDFFPVMIQKEKLKAGIKG